MIQNRTTPVLSLFVSACLILSAPAFAAEKTGDPNAAVRKMQANNNPLAELERVQKINNELAVQHFTGLIKKNARDANAYAKRGKAYAGLKDYSKAMKDYDKAIELDAKRTEAYIGRAVARFMQKDFNGS